MFSEIRKRVKKIGKAPGTPTYTGEQRTKPPVVTVINYSLSDFYETSNTDIETCFAPDVIRKGTTWVNIEGLNDVELIKALTKRYNIHPLTVEDILNVEQRPKVEEFKNYLFITLKVLIKQEHAFTTKQVSFILGNNFLLSFQELDTTLFDNIRIKLRSKTNQTLRKEGPDYLMYRLIDTIVDDYFATLEVLGDEIEEIEENIIANPTSQSARTIYKIKREMLLVRKAIWPMRELLSHLAHAENNRISKFTMIYLRDVYDHTVQAIDSLETFREMLSSMLDVYLSSITNRMNEIMKTLTIITTIFIPITALASIYGMNFHYIPGLDWRFGYIAVLGSMGLIAFCMMLN